jgi:hypothetical protein
VWKHLGSLFSEDAINMINKGRQKKNHTRLREGILRADEIKQIKEGYRPEGSGRPCNYKMQRIIANELQRLAKVPVRATGNTIEDLRAFANFLKVQIVV